MTALVVGRYPTSDSFGAREYGIGLRMAANEHSQALFHQLWSLAFRDMHSVRDNFCETFHD
ncbi:hypothetical protein ACRQ5Q_28310 [Bradyrhizobium sp. PMVTL-01]|uniref:hypothetical protein n=1 Tax=unclassified Bradyrhizobium TaxID=2631580 RepID=UPI003F6F4EF9